MDKVIKRIFDSLDNLAKSTERCLKCGSKKMHVVPMFGAGSKLICDDCGEVRLTCD